MTVPMPVQTPVLMHHQAEIADLRWVASHSLASHDRSAARLAEKNPGLALPTACPCALCRHSRAWVGTPVADLLNAEEDAAMDHLEASHG